VDARIRRTPGRAKLLAVAVATIGLAAPATAQLPPPRSLSPTELNAFPDISPGKPADAKADEALLPPTGIPVGTPVWSATPSQPPLPQPSATGAPANTPVWTANPQTRTMTPGNAGQRSPQDFGQGWKNFVNQQATGRDAPAAMLATPRGAIVAGPRPDWSWHGYDGWNQGNRIPPPPEALMQASTLASEMAPYMKYAHLWKLSSSAVGGNSAGVAAGPAPTMLAPAAATAPAAGAPAAPANNGATISGYYAPNVEWRGTITPDAAATGAPTQTSYTPPARPSQAVPEPPGAAGYRIPLNIRERISAICDGKSRNLVVEQPSPIRLRIAFLVRTPADAESLTTQLAALPELGPYKVDFEVQIGQ
jgi:hypothetical protein